MAKDQAILNFSDSGTRKMVRSYIDQLRGLHWFEVRKCRNQRTLSQNAFFHGVWLPRIAARYSVLWGYIVDPEEAKADLKDRFLRTMRLNKETGEKCGMYTKHTADLDVAEFAEFLDQVKQHAQDFLDIELPEANQFMEATA